MIREIRFVYELLNKDGVFKQNLYNVIDCTVRYNSTSTLKGSATLTMTEDKRIDFINDVVRVVCYISEEKFVLGEFLLCSTRRNIEGDFIIRECQLFSKLVVLEDERVEERHVCNAGVNIINEVKRLIGDRGMDISESSLALQVYKEWELGTPKLTIINDLLSLINWGSLRVDVNGKFTTAPYIVPSERQVEFNIIADENSILFPNKSDELDLFKIPNVVILRTNIGEINPPLQAVVVNDNPDSPTSTASRGRRIVYFEEVSDLVNQEQLTAKAKRKLYDLTDVYNAVEIETSIQPAQFGSSKCLYLKSNTIEGKYIQEVCEIECKAGGVMRRQLRKAVKI